MFSHIHSFVIVLKVFGSSIFFILIGSILNNFAPLQVKPKHFNSDFSGTFSFFFVILLRACFLSRILFKDIHNNILCVFRNLIKQTLLKLFSVIETSCHNSYFICVFKCVNEFESKVPLIDFLNLVLTQQFSQLKL